MRPAESPLDAKGTTKSDIFKVFDTIFTVAFIIELVLKHIVLGVMYYWTNAWNVLDGVIVAISIVIMSTDGNGAFSSLRALRTLRVLRPLRMINRAPGLKRVVNALLFSIPKILDVLVVCCLFFLIFAILGITISIGPSIYHLLQPLHDAFRKVLRWLYYEVILPNVMRCHKHGIFELLDNFG